MLKYFKGIIADPRVKQAIIALIVALGLAIFEALTNVLDKVGSQPLNLVGG